MPKVSRKKVEAYRAWRKGSEGRPGCEFVLEKLKELVGPGGQLVVAPDRVLATMKAAYKCLEPPTIVAKRSPNLRFLDSCIDPNNTSKENVATMIAFVEATNRVWIRELFTKGREGYSGLEFLEKLHKQRDEIRSNAELSSEVKIREMKIRMNEAIDFVEKIAQEASTKLMATCDAAGHSSAGPGGSTAAPADEPLPFLPSPPVTQSPLPRTPVSTGVAKAADPFVLPSAYFRSMPTNLSTDTFGKISADPLDQRKNGTKWVSKTISRIDNHIWSALSQDRDRLKGFKTFYINLCRITNWMESKMLSVGKWWEWVSAVTRSLNPNKIPVTSVKKGHVEYVDKFYCAAFLYAFQFFQPGSPSAAETYIRERFIEMGKSSIKDVSYGREGPPIGGFLVDLFSFGIPMRVGTGPESCVGAVDHSPDWRPIVYSDGGGGMGSTESRAPAPATPLEIRRMVPIALPST